MPKSMVRLQFSSSLFSMTFEVHFTSSIITKIGEKPKKFPHGSRPFKTSVHLLTFLISHKTSVQGSVMQPWMSFQSASGTSKGTTAHFSIFCGPGVHVSPSLFLSDKTVLQDNTEVSTASETATQPQQGNCTVYIAFYILLQSHLYFITTRTKIYICSQ